ncbi:MAG: hypothetical protein LIO65_08995 [Odoribacter sp.]|nr:hypothetical protein [Odoribacter sp.]
MERKIAANYIYLADSCLYKNAYVVIKNGEVERIIDTGGVMKEISGLEFYGGLLVEGFLQGLDIRNLNGESILPFLDTQYREKGRSREGIAIITGADLINFVFTKDSRIEKIR